VYTSGVLINPEPNASFTASSTEGCAPHKAFFTNTSNNSIPVTFAWDFGNGSSSEYFNPSYTYTLPGNYSVSLRVSSGNGCDTVYQISNLITVHENPLSDFLIQPTEAQILEDSLSEPVQLITSSADSVWYIVLGDTLQGMTQEIYFAAPGVYPVLMYAENECGCRDSTLRYITVKSEGWLYIPTAFSPNNDGLNDIFQVIGQNITEFEMSIYNRWGQRVYYSRDAESGWDGRTQFGTDIVYNGMYLYKISAVDQKGNQIEREGLFTLYK
jgi:gliding motility-associated-like protein